MLSDTSKVQGSNTPDSLVSKPKHLIDSVSLFKTNDSLSHNANHSVHSDSLNAKTPVQTLQPLDTASKNKNINLSPKDSLHIKQSGDKTGLKDTSFKAKPDSLKKDTVKIDPMTLDSTARLEYFHYQRSEDPYVKIKNKKQSKFFANVKARERKIEIDSTGEYVQIRELVAGQETKILLRMKFEDYLAMRMRARDRELWEELGYKYEIKKTEKDLGGLIKDFTDFEIPLPSVGVLSIFGTPKISLKIGGSVLIHGAWRNEKTEGATTSLLGNTRNEPDFKQEVQINVNGTIGDKLAIAADWNTERTFEYENQLHIKYTGYSDEIVQSVEAGNVSLQTSNLVGGGEALFGVKAGFKMGPLTLTAIASQKKGEIKEVALSGGSSTNTFAVRAYEYSKSNYFIDSVYADTNLNIFANYYKSRGTSTVNTNYIVTDIEVWKNIVTSTYNPNQRYAVAYISLQDLPQGQTKYSTDVPRDNVTLVPGEVEKTRFIRLEKNVDYEFHPETGFITFKSQLSDQDIIAVSFKTKTRSVGEMLSTAASDTSATLVLKLVKPSSLIPQYKKAWNLMLKNIYPLKVSNVKKDGFSLDIKYVQEGADSLNAYGSTRYLNAFGFDNVDAAGNSNQDGLFDYYEGITILPSTGEIIFPVLQPFGRDFPKGIPDSLKFQDVYDTTSTAASQNSVKNKFVITGKVSGTATSVYTLGFNIVENSVKVTLDGRQLTAGVDYVMDYNVGQLTIRNSDALVPNANLKISYEQNDLFQLASKTLVGLRGMLDISQNTKLGFSMLNLTQQTLSDKVRLGEEPISNSIYGVDFTTSSEMPFMTKLLDHVISTKEKSSITFSGELAYMNPDPNTKKSTIASDKGQSIAYIDDFEGSKKTIPIGVTYGSWKDISVPMGMPLDYMPMMDYKGKAWWYNSRNNIVQVTKIWPKKKVASGDENVTVMDFVFRPTLSGAYNYNKAPKDSANIPKWGGMMKRLSTSSTDLNSENMEFIEFWINPRNYTATDTIFIDIGKISEDIIPNGNLDKEDKNGNLLYDDQTEDYGLDQMNDDAERAAHPNGDSDDPAHDNYSYSASSVESEETYMHINGTQGNMDNLDNGSRVPDTEDLNNNGSLDALNSYIEYAVPVTPDATNKYLVPSDGSVNKWYLYRIPLKDSLRVMNGGSLSNVETVRLYVKGQSQEIAFRLAEFNFVGNQWQKTTVTDTLMEVTVVNVEDNSDYTSPPGVEREKDRSRPDQDIVKNEQSLNLQVKKLPAGESRTIFKTMAKSLDVFSYKEMKLFVHGDMTTNNTVNISNYTNVDKYAAEVFYRFGADSNNYYEYRQPVQKDWQEIDIIFSTLTSIKAGRDSTKKTGDTLKVPVTGKPGHYYVVKGSPSLTNLSSLVIGISAMPQKVSGDPDITGDVWINELRVIGADDTPGWAYTASTTIKLADLMNISMNISKTDPNFHKLSDRFGSRVDSKSWGVAADLDIIKLLPFDMNGSNLKVSYSHSESISKPRYLTGSDMNVESSAAQLKASLIEKGYSVADATDQANKLIGDTQTITTSDSWNLSSIRLKLPTDYWLIRDSFNALTFGFNYNKSFSRNPTTLNNSSWVWNASMNYAINFNPEDYFYPANIPFFGTIIGLFKDYRNVKVYYAPQTFSADVTVKRSRSYNTPRLVGSATDNSTMIARDFTTTRGCNLAWKFTDGGFLNLSANMSIDINSSLAFLETDQWKQQRSESSIWHDIFSGVFFGRDYSYSQNLDIRTNPKLPALWEINRNFTLTTGYTVRYGWNFDFSQDKNGKSAQYDAKSNVQFTVRWKDLTAPLFVSDNQPEDNRQNNGFPQGAPRGRGRNADREVAKEVTNMQNREIVKHVSLDSLYKNIPDTMYHYMPDTLRKAALDSLKKNIADSVRKAETGLMAHLPDTTEIIHKTPAYKTALAMLKLASKTMFFDYESISVTLSNGNTRASNGLWGSGNGSKNFFGFSYNADSGPSRLFMIGLSNDVGKRVNGVILTDNYSQQNNLEFKTSKPLWEGARVDLNWKVGWTYQKTNKYSLDSVTGLPQSSTQTTDATGTLERSFLSLPPTLIFSFLKNGIKQVHSLYEKKASATQQDLSDAFVDGFESFPWLSKTSFLKEFAKYIPRANWHITWDGLEKFYIFKGYTKKVSLEHTYTSGYSESWKLNSDGAKEMSSQRISYGFSPLIGLSMTFNSLWEGNFTGSIKYSVKNDYSLSGTTKSISEGANKEIGISADYSKSGFEIPFFGLSLKNDIQFTLSYTYSKNTTISYDMTDYTDAGLPQDGTTRTTIEPRIKYVMSSKVTLSVFYKRTTQKPEGASALPATTTNEMGLDVNISISQ